MTTYKGIKGFSVKFVSANPPVAQEGEVFYNSPGSSLKLYIATGAWSAGSNMVTARDQLGGAGTQTAASIFGGSAPPKANHEYYDGSSWSEQTDINTSRGSVASGGTQTASLLAGGYTTTNVTNTETWNGSSWTETTDIPAAKGSGGGAGTTTDGIIFGGNSQFANTLAWNGSTWTTVNSNTHSYPAEGTALDAPQLTFPFLSIEILLNLFLFACGNFEFGIGLSRKLHISSHELVFSMSIINKSSALFLK